MNNTIYKYPLQINDEVAINLPLRAEILCVQIQNGNLCLWAQIDSNEIKTQQRLFRIYGTGHKIDTSQVIQYIDTVQMINDSLVFHIFEIIP